MLKEAGLEIASFEKLNLLSLNPLVEKLVTDCSGAKKITSWDSKLSKVPVINNFFDTFVISARLKK
jgi:hypothetical protein